MCESAVIGCGLAIAARRSIQFSLRPDESDCFQKRSTDAESRIIQGRVFSMQEMPGKHSKRSEWSRRTERGMSRECRSRQSRLRENAWLCRGSFVRKHPVLLAGVSTRCLGVRLRWSIRRPEAFSGLPTGRRGLQNVEQITLVSIAGLME